MLEDRIFVDRGNNDALLASLMNNRDNDGWSDNPFIYLVWMMFANKMWGNNYGDNGSNPQIAALQDTVNTNHNNDVVLAAILGNTDAVRELAGAFNTSFNIMNSAICDVKSGILTVAGQIGYSSEKVINAVTLGDMNITSAVKDCCCATLKAILEMNGDIKLANCQLTNAITSTITQGVNTLNTEIIGVGNELHNDINNLSFQSQQQHCAQLTAMANQTQILLDTLRNHWYEEIQLKYQDAKLELSQQLQNAYLISQLKPIISAA